MDLHSRVERLKLLTPRQREVLRLKADAGMTNQEIAAALGVSKETIRTHINDLREKLQISEDDDSGSEYRTYSLLLSQLDLPEEKGDFTPLFDSPPPLMEESPQIISTPATPMPTPPTPPRRGGGLVLVVLLLIGGGVYFLTHRPPSTPPSRDYSRLLDPATPRPCSSPTDVACIRQ